MFVIRPYCSADMDDVLTLWQNCGLTHPNNNPVKDIARKMKVNPEWFLVGVMDDKLVASVMVGYDGHRGWINYLGVDPAYRKQGLGRAIMQHAEIILRSVGCPKINLQVRNTNTAVVEFYKEIGFSIDECFSMGKRLEIDNKSSCEKDGC